MKKVMLLGIVVMTFVGRATASDGKELVINRTNLDTVSVCVAYSDGSYENGICLQPLKNVANQESVVVYVPAALHRDASRSARSRDPFDIQSHLAIRPTPEFNGRAKIIQIAGKSASGNFYRFAVKYDDLDLDNTNYFTLNSHDNATLKTSKGSVTYSIESTSLASAPKK